GRFQLECGAGLDDQLRRARAQPANHFCLAKQRDEALLERARETEKIRDLQKLLALESVKHARAFKRSMRQRQEMSLVIDRDLCEFARRRMAIPQSKTEETLFHELSLCQVVGYRCINARPRLWRAGAARPETNRSLQNAGERRVPGQAEHGCARSQK